MTYYTDFFRAFLLSNIAWSHITQMQFHLRPQKMYRLPRADFR